MHVHGQATNKSEFENKIDNYLKLYLANFDFTSEKIDGTDRVIETTKPSWVKKGSLVSKATIQDKNGETTKLKLNFSFYHYENSIKSKAAMDSILNCFGGECTKLSWGVKDQSAKTPPCIFIFKEKEIISCFVSCEQKNNYWTLFIPDLEKTFSSAGSKVLESDCGGPIVFREK